MKIGIMGVAHPNAEIYIRHLQAMADVEVIGNADTDTQRGKNFAARFNLQHFEAYEMLLNEKPDAVIICAETVYRRRLIEMVANANIYVLCEMPLATTLEDAQAIETLCQKNHRILMPAFPLRYSAPIREIANLVWGDELGKVYAVNALYQSVRPREAWRINKQLAGGGAIADHLPHIADLMHWILNAAATGIYAEVNHIFHAAEGDVETGALVSLTFADTIVTVDCSWSKPASYSAESHISLELVTEKGLVTVNPFKQAMNVYSNARANPYAAYWGSDLYQFMLRDFIENIGDGAGSPIAADYGYRAASVVGAAYHSTATGQPV